MVWLSTATLPALDPARTPSQYNLRTWTRPNGLPANGVNAIAQTRDGYLWLGTALGLFRFDGREFKAVDLHRFRSPVTIALCRSRTDPGGLWFGLEQGAFGFCDGNNASFLGKAEWGGVSLTVHALLESRAGDLWVAGQNVTGRLAGHTQYEPVLNTPTGRDYYDTLSMLEDSRRRVWLGTTARGLFYWRDGALTKFPDPMVNQLTIRALAEDKRGRLWIGTELGLLCYDTNFQRQALPFPWYETRALVVDRQGTVWAGTSGGGLVRFRGDSTPMSLRKSDGLADDYLTALAEDREGNLWIGTRNGLNQLSDVKLPTAGKAEGLTADQYLSVAPARAGGVWLAASSGFARFDGQVHAQHADAKLRNPYLKRILEARNGDLYLINGSMDIEIISGGKIVARHLNSSWPTALAEDQDGVIAAVGGQLYRVGTNYFQPYPYAGTNRPPACWVFNLLAARDGSLWTAGAEGICRIRTGAVEQVTGPDPLGGCKANCLCEDAEGVIWAGLETGIARYCDGRVRIIGREQGLFDQVIHAIVPDDHGFLWVASGRGFFRVSRRALNDLAEGRTNRVQCLAYAGLEAVKSFERNSQEPSGCKSADGRIWFPTAQGVVVIQPTNLPINAIAPAVFVDQVRINGALMDRSRAVVARPGRGDLEFCYTALSYAAPEKIRFQYRLEGYDPDWVDAGDRRVALYTNLKPGSYVFRVIAANADGIWNRAGDTVEFELEPHFYQSALFYFLVALLVAALLVAACNWRVRHVKHWQKQLEQSRDLLEGKVAERTAALAKANECLTREVEQRVGTQAELEQQKAALEKEIEERKRMQLEIERVHGELLELSRQAGQAEVASSVLHNVGNVLNSINVSTAVISERLGKLPVDPLAKSVQMLQAHADQLATFLTRDAKGRKLPHYLEQVAAHLAEEKTGLRAELKELAENVEHIKEIVAMQQTYARVSGVLEKIPIRDVVESAMKMHSMAYLRHSVAMERDYEQVPPVVVDRHKVLQILINLLHNAKYACEGSNRPKKKVTIRIRRNGDDQVRVEVADNGIGIAPENMTRIFGHSFTTRKGGHGFGLHSAAVAAREMGGQLTAESQGLGRGSTFILDLPFQPPEPGPV